MFHLTNSINPLVLRRHSGKNKYYILQFLLNKAQNSRAWTSLIIVSDCTVCGDPSLAADRVKQQFQLEIVEFSDPSSAHQTNKQTVIVREKRKPIMAT